MLRVPFLTAALVLLAFPLGTSAQAQFSSRVQVGDHVEVLWRGGMEEVWISATITEISDHGSIRAAFPAEVVGMYTESGEANEWFPDSSVRLPGETEPLSADLPSPPPPAEPPGHAGPTPPEALPTEYAVGDSVRAWCFGTLERAVVTAVEPGRYRLWFKGYGSSENSELGCGAFRPAGDVLPEEPEAPAPPTPPLPTTLPTGAYACFASVPHYAGSTYISGVGSVANYTFTWERVGDFALTSGSAVRIGGSTYGYVYDAATGQITWRGGMHEGIPSNAGYDGEGRFEIQIHRKDGQRGTWHCQP